MTIACRVLVFVVVVLAGTSTSAWIGGLPLPTIGAAQAQPLPSCVRPPRCPPGETAECDRGTCVMRPGQPAVIGCVRAACVPAFGGPLPKLIMRQCAAPPRCGAGRVAVCTTQGQCARTIRGNLGNGCLVYSCVARL